MKKLFFLAALLAAVFTQSYATEKSLMNSDLLDQYFSIKDALVAGKPDIASNHAAEFVKAAASVDAKMLPDASRALLIKDASAIANTKDLKKQRQLFSEFSENITALAKVIKYSKGDIYKAYCPMAKAGWLSKEAAIRNPYYGNAMLTCGKVVETIK